MFWPDEIRSTGGLDLPDGEERTVRPKELAMAEKLVASLADRFRPESYRDTYRSALEELIQAKLKGETRNATRRRPSPKVIDLMEALKASVESAAPDRAEEEARLGRPPTTQADRRLVAVLLRVDSVLAGLRRPGRRGTGRGQRSLVGWV